MERVEAAGPCPKRREEVRYAHRGAKAATIDAKGEVRGRRGEDVPPVKGVADHGPPKERRTELPHVDFAGHRRRVWAAGERAGLVRKDRREEAVVRPNEDSPARENGDTAALATDAGVHYGDYDRIRRERVERGLEEPRAMVDGEGLDIVRQVTDWGARGDPRDDGLELPDERVAPAVIGEEEDGPGQMCHFWTS